MENAPYRPAASRSEMKTRDAADPRPNRAMSSNDSDDDSGDEEMGKQPYTRGRPNTLASRGTGAGDAPPPSASSRHNTRAPPSKTRRSLYFQIVMGLAAIGCFVLGVFVKYTNLSSGIIWGSVLSAFSVVTVLLSYASDPLSRQHPNPLVFWRTIADGFFVVRLLAEQFVRCVNYQCSPLCVTFNCGCAFTRDALLGYLPAGNDTCIFFAGFFQFSLLASECWFLCMTLNLFLSLTNPFTDFKRNTRFFHVFSWGVPLASAVLLASLADFAGYSDFDTCWTNALRGATTIPRLTDTCVNESRTFILKDKTGSLQANYISWGFFYVPMLVFIVVGLVVWIWTYNRLREGLPETYGVRKQSIDRARFLVVAVSMYWTIIFAVYATVRPRDTKQRWKEVVNFLMASKGYVDLVIWFQLNDLRVPTPSALCSKNDQTVDVDLNPQVNAALRREVLFYTTSGIIQAVQQAETLAEHERVQHLALRPQGTPPPSSQHYTKTFHDYEPHAFRRIRQCFHVDNIRYLKSLSSTAKERLSEGASGAFMFFSGDGSLIVKSTSPDECKFLRGIADAYATYMCTHPSTLLTRFYGCHCLELYGQQFSFVVMANLFATPQTIHTRFDIKGSWVNRKGGLPKRGKKVTCRHCNRKYVYQSTAKDDLNCDVRLGGHEPNIVLKDSDLTQKLKLDTNVAVALYRQLEADSNMLCEFGIMDYSLLMGIHDVEFKVDAVDDDDDETTVVRPPRRVPRSGKRVANTVVGPAYYHLGVIDILQTWTLQKRMERFVKVHLRRVDGDGLSAIAPDKYKKRFQAKMAEILNVGHLIGTPQQRDLYTAVQSSQMDIDASEVSGVVTDVHHGSGYVAHTGANHHGEGYTADHIHL
ncbi:hypothetical protein DYB32_004742 [Aphanomyces invadans]|uniref:PIPK domain-containing protein n=1 Tax=Aphanomyces invadans TaxID=157072 RepID=A0A418AWM2_9STRA|nr:hypothetical protein DYB32_004742 [Aphanomyces invadans]